LATTTRAEPRAGVQSSAASERLPAEADIFISGNGGAVNDKCITQDNHFDVELAKDASSSSPHRRS
jgi:hypothetical protein